MTDEGDDLYLGHDGYLKSWALGRPVLPFEYILLDEAQDTNEVVLGVLGQQSAQIVYVGDKHQQIYEWRGAVNAMEKIGGCEEAFLTQSFRFGPNIAMAATDVLRTLGEPRCIRGNPKRNSRVVHTGKTRTVLARTNSAVMSEVLVAIAAGRTPHIVGGSNELEEMIEDVFELKAGKPGKRPEFFGFKNWQEVVAFSETQEGENIKMFVNLVTRHGERALYKAVKSTTDTEEEADLVLSTAHKAKGREWDSVRLSSDFAIATSGPDGTIPESEVRLFYVAMTRAKELLCVDQEILHLFQSGAWKRKKPSTGRQSQVGGTGALPVAPGSQHPRPAPIKVPPPKATGSPQLEALRSPPRTVAETAAPLPHTSPPLPIPLARPASRNAPPQRVGTAAKSKKPAGLWSMLGRLFGG
jgi:hypothetical protein